MNIVLLLAHIYSITTGMLSYGHGITIGGLADEYDIMMCLIEKLLLLTIRYSITIGRLANRYHIMIGS